jgi:hypothetical protein
LFSICIGKFVFDCQFALTLSDSDICEQGINTMPPRKKAKIWYRQPFNDEWLQIEAVLAAEMTI